MHPNDGRVVSNFINQALTGQNITIYGDGSQTRSFCYVDDLVAGLIKLMDSEPSFTGPVNLGNPEEISISDLAGLVIKLSGADVSVVNKSLPADDPRQRRPDINLAMTRLNWRPKIELEDGLRRTIAYFKSLN